MAACLATMSCSGPCAKCGVYQRDGVHLLELAIYCAACCPECNTSASEWESETAVTIDGEQEKLF